MIGPHNCQHGCFPSAEHLAADPTCRLRGLPGPMIACGRDFWIETWPDGRVVSSRLSGTPVEALSAVVPAPSDEGWQGACSLPTAPGFLIFGAIGALSARKGKRVAGAIDGLLGAWLGCAAARAMGIQNQALAAAMTMVGAHVSARTYES